MQDSNILIKIFESYPDVWQDSRRFKALLSDFLPENKLRRNLLSLSVDENIPGEIRERNSVSNIDLHRWTQRIVNACGCVDSLAEEIIDMWLAAFGLCKQSDEKIPTQALAPKSETNFETISAIPPTWIRDLNVSSRVLKCLKDAKIVTLDGLLRRSPEQLLGIRGLGPKSLQEIEYALKEQGLELPKHPVKKQNEKIITFPSSRRTVNNDDFIIDNKTLIRYMGKCNGETVTVPQGVERIADNAFVGCNIKKVILPKGIITIGDNAFKDCSSLMEINLPEGLSKIGTNAFEGSGLEHIEIPQSTTEIGFYAFGGCSFLREIKLPVHLMSKTDRFSIPASCKVRCS